jgi:hypothetical protein
MFGITNLFSGRKHTSRKGTIKPQFDALESRDLMSVSPILGSIASISNTLKIGPSSPQPTAAGLALINGLTDPTVRSAALTDYQRDGAITRNDMIDIFSQGTSNFDFVSSPALASLKTLVSHATTIGMPQYVQNLASKVISGNPLGASGAQTIGERVDDFFLGQVHPDFSYIPYDGAATVEATFVQVNNPLWNNRPSYQDATEAYYVSDSWLMSSLREVAYRNPAEIMSMFIANGDGTYTIRFFNGTTPDYVTVDSTLPSGPSNDIDSSTPVFVGVSPQPVMWAALIEKAYAQENAAGWIGTSHKGMDSYQALNFGKAQWALSAVTGLNTTSSTTVNANAIATAWSHGSFVVLSTTTPDSDLLAHFSDYAMVNYSDGWVTVTPLGPLGGSYFIEVDTSVLAANFSSWTQASATTAAARRNVVANPYAAQTGLYLDTAMLASLSQVKHHGGVAALPLSLDAA